MTHTLGPWEIERAGKMVAGNDSIGIYVDQVNGDTICDLYFDAGSQLIQFENAEANARLIAAAPDLLSQLKIALAWMVHGLDRQSSETDRLDLENDIENVRAAIAKATEPRQE